MGYFVKQTKSSKALMAYIIIFTGVLAGYFLYDSAFEAIERFQKSQYEDLGAFVFLVLGILSAIAALYSSKKLFNWIRHPETHPIHVELSKFGKPELIASAIENELMMETKRFGASLLLENWVLNDDLFSVKIMRYDELIWLYPRQTDNRTNYVRMDTDWGVVLHDKRNQEIELKAGNTLKRKIDQASVARLNEAQSHVLHRAPWVKVGYTDKLHRLIVENSKNLDVILEIEMEEFRRNGSNLTERNRNQTTR